MNNLKTIIFYSLFGICVTASAQNVINADSSSAQATIRRDEKGFASCGIRVVSQVVMPKEAEVYDFSLNLDGASVMGLLKAGKYMVPGNARQGWNIEKRKTVLPGPKDFWFSERASDIPLKPVKLAKGEDAGFSLGLAEFKPTADVVMAILNGQVVQFALRYPNDKMDRIISFKVDMPKADAETFLDCLSGLQRRIESDLNAAEKRN